MVYLNGCVASLSINNRKGDDRDRDGMITEAGS